MKIVRLVIIASLSSVLLFVACEQQPDKLSESKDEENVKELKSKEEEIKSEEKETLKEIGLGDLDVAKAYADHMTGGISILADGLQSFRILTEEVKLNPASFVADSDWRANMDDALTAMEEGIIILREGVPSSYQKRSHEVMMNALDNYDYVVNNFVGTIDNGDIRTFRICTTYINEANEFMKEVIELTKEETKAIEQAEAIFRK